MKKHIVVGVIALLSACSNKDGAAPTSVPDKAASTAGAPAAAPTDKLLSAGGVGAIRFGMTLDQAERASGAKANLPAPLDPACSMARFPTLPKLRFMVENGIVTRADADPGVESALGVAIGDAFEQVRARYPEAQVSAHKYDEHAHYLTFPDADGRAAVILEEAGGTITGMRAGLQPSVAYVETCG